MVTLLLLWLPGAIPAYFLLRHPNTVTIVTMAWMFIVFLLLLRFWSQQYGQLFFKRYGLEWTRQNGIDLLKGLMIGLGSVLSLFILKWSAGWIELGTPSALGRTVAEGLLSAVGIGLAEELVFRGWLLDELQQDYSSKTALWANATIFALLHFLKPLEEIVRTWLQFPGLVLLGLTLVWARRGHQQRLGICIGLHAGLVWGYYLVDVGQLIESSSFPVITGIDGNPLAGLLGLTLLSILAGWSARGAGKNPCGTRKGEIVATRRSKGKGKMFLRDGERTQRSEKS